MKTWHSNFCAITTALLITHCGGSDGGGSGDTGGSTNGSSASNTGDSNTSNGGDGGGASNSTQGNGSNSTAGDDAGADDTGNGGATSGVNNGMATTGPTEVDFTFKGSETTPIKFVSGFGYFDPRGPFDDEDPALKIVLTNWKIDACDPQGIKDTKDATGKAYLYCSLFKLRRGKARPAWVVKGEDTGFTGSGGSYGCFADLTSGDDDGGEQIVGTLTITGDPQDEFDVVAEIPIRVNHCGVIDAKGNI